MKALKHKIIEPKFAFYLLIILTPLYGLLLWQELWYDTDLRYVEKAKLNFPQRFQIGSVHYEVLSTDLCDYSYGFLDYWNKAKPNTVVIQVDKIEKQSLRQFCKNFVSPNFRDFNIFFVDKNQDYDWSKLSKLFCNLDNVDKVFPYKLPANIMAIYSGRGRGSSVCSSSAFPERRKEFANLISFKNGRFSGMRYIIFKHYRYNNLGFTQKSFDFLNYSLKKQSPAFRMYGIKELNFNTLSSCFEDYHPQYQI